MSGGTARRPSRLRLGKPSGKPTTRPPIRAVKVVLADSRRPRQSQPQLKKALRTFTPVVTARNVRPIKTLLAKIRRGPVRTFTRFTDVFGTPTRLPPVRDIVTVTFAAGLRAQRRRIKGGITHINPVRYFAPPVAPPNLHRLRVNIETGALYWRPSGTAVSPIGYIPV